LDELLNPKSADRRRWRTVVGEDSAMVTCVLSSGAAGSFLVFVVVVPGTTLVL
jgi:hypothetical protein